MSSLATDFGLCGVLFFFIIIVPRVLQWLTRAHLSPTCIRSEYCCQRGNLVCCPDRACIVRSSPLLLLWTVKSIISVLPYVHDVYGCLGPMTPIIPTLIMQADSYSGLRLLVCRLIDFYGLLAFVVPLDYKRTLCCHSPESACSYSVTVWDSPPLNKISGA